MRFLVAVCLALARLPLSATAQAVGPERLDLSLEEAIGLVLSKSRSAISARLGREEQALMLEAEEERYDPVAGSLSLRTNATSQGDETADFSLGPSLRVRTGGSSRLSWREPLAGERGREASTTLSFSQPLLKGFGPELDTQPLRRARLQERVYLRHFRDTAAAIVKSAISAYRAVLRAGRRLTIAREALERARRQLEINRALVEAGRMAPQDLVQTEADVPDKEYALTDAENALETAFARRTDWLSAEIGIELARMGLAERRQSIRIQVRRAVHDVAVALRQIDLSRQRRAPAERKLDVERRKLQQGLSPIFQLSRFEDDLVTAQRRELDVVARYRDTLGTTLDRWGIGVEQVGR